MWIPDSLHPEIDAMYAAGLTVPQIGELLAVRVVTIHRHLEGRRAVDPSLAVARAAAPRGPTKAWRNKLAALRTFIATHGRFPTLHGEEAGEQQLYGWLAAQRHALISQTLGWAKMEALGVLGDFVTTDLEREWDRQWHERLGQVVEFIAEHGRRPRLSAPKGGLEHVLAIWTATQHHETLRGRISAGRLAKLDADLPGWRRTKD